MSYVVLARKYRPQNFDEVVGQEHITKILKNAITHHRVSHAYLFCGPRGIGKTSCARILAKSLNCQDGPTVTPCNKCPACVEINQGNSFDVLEIDGASNRGIDEIRTLRENVKFAPGRGKYKIYIVDEVHMLTTEAFNALLKTLEEPPPHVKFIFATTDPNKVPSTIISRCQRYDFKRIGLKAMADALGPVCRSEKFKAESEALFAIAKAAQGSLRDALSILDQLSAVSERGIQSGDVYAMLGLVEVEDLFRLTDELAAKDCARALGTLNEVIDKGKDVKQLGRDLLEHFRNLMVIKIGGKSLGKLVDYPIDVKEMYLAQSARFSVSGILRAIDLLIEAQDVSRITEFQRTPLEIALAKIVFGGGGPADVPPEPSAETIPEQKRPRAAVTPARHPARGILRNEKGHIDISGGRNDDSAQETVPAGPEFGDAAVPETALTPATDLAAVKRSWDALTYAVSRKKMSVATYLQEGYPVSLEDGKLRVGFSQEHEFHKHVLEGKENIALVEAVFAEKLKHAVRVSYEFIRKDGVPQREEEDPRVQEALENFKGKVVSKWNKE